MTEFSKRKLERLERFHTEITRAFNSKDEDEVIFAKIKHILNDLDYDLKERTREYETNYNSMPK